MSDDEKNPKRRCVDPVSSAAVPAATSHEAPVSIGFRDLIFSVTGTVPQSFDFNSSSTACQLIGSGTPFVSHVEQKRLLQASSESTGKGKKKSTWGSISYTPDADHNKSQEETFVLSEADVGITEFISQHEGFSGILKQRYSDFVVNEINRMGEVVHLTDISQPPKEWTPQDADNDDNADVISDEQKILLEKLVESKSEADEVSIAASCKDVRRKLHLQIKSAYPNLDCNTVEKDGVKYVVVKHLCRKVEKRSRKPSCFTKATGNYCKFVLYKENCDTQYAIGLIARYLRSHPSNFGFAGTKDRRGKTTQEVTVHRIPPHNLYQTCKGLRNIVVGNFSICKEPLKLGDLRGNRFIIVLRNVTGSDQQIEDGMKSLCSVGFVNYYGMQRFGTTRVSTHSIGRALLKGSWTEAIELIMKPREGDKFEMVEARKVWQETHDAQKTLDALKGFHCNERQLLEGLKRSAKSDLVGALSFIPRNMRLMYLHAYQSYIWNRVVSRRIREFGLAPRPGDLVFQGVLEEPTAFTEIEEKCKDAPVSSSRIEPILVTEDNVTEYSITDVVLPLPGYDVRYPENESGLWYKEFLAADGMENVDFRSKIKDYSLPGSYRKIVVKPENVSWEVLLYNDYEKPLIETDLDRLRQHKTPSSRPTKPEQTNGDNDTKYRALKMELSLPASSYATMAVREVLKCGTSAAYQSTLNTA